jgi:hypothetical protein
MPHGIEPQDDDELKKILKCMFSRWSSDPEFFLQGLRKPREDFSVQVAYTLDKNSGTHLPDVSRNINVRLPYFLCMTPITVTFLT